MLETISAATAPARLPLHLVAEIEHRIANEYAEAISSLMLAAAGTPQGEGRSAIAAAVQRLRVHAEAHRALMPPIDGEVDLAAYLSVLCEALSKSALAGRAVRLSLHADELWLPSGQAWRLSLAITELIRNAARHGLRGRSGSIRVKLTLDADALFVRVSDNGSGRGSPLPGSGMNLVRTLAGELGGSAAWQFTRHGCEATIRLPLTQGLDLPAFAFESPTLQGRFVGDA